MFGRSAEFWVGLLAAAAFVFMRHKDNPLPSRLIITGISASLGFSLTDEFVGPDRGESLVAVVVVVFSYLILDVGSMIVTDKDFRADLLNILLGRKK